MGQVQVKHKVFRPKILLLKMLNTFHLSDDHNLRIK